MGFDSSGSVDRGGSARLRWWLVLWVLLAGLWAVGEPDPSWATDPADEAADVVRLRLMGMWARSLMTIARTGTGWTGRVGRARITPTCGEAGGVSPRSLRRRAIRRAC